MCYDCNTFIPFICCYKTVSYVTEDYKSTIDKREDPEAKKIKHYSGVPGHLHLGVPDLLVMPVVRTCLIEKAFMRIIIYAKFRKNSTFVLFQSSVLAKCLLIFFLSKGPRHWKVKRCSL